MTTFALIGAGPGLGLAAARRFGNAGHTVALLSRSTEHLDDLMPSWRGRTSRPAASPPTSSTPPPSPRPCTRPRTAGARRDPSVQPGAPRRLHEAGPGHHAPTDLDAPLAFSVKGPVTAVNAVLPGMRDSGRGTLLFVNGGSAVRPNPDRGRHLDRFAAESAYAQMLHDALAPENIHAAQLIVPGAISPDAEHSSPEVLAERLYGLHTDRDGFRHYAEPMPDPQDAPHDHLHPPPRPDRHRHCRRLLLAATACSDDSSAEQTPATASASSSAARLRTGFGVGEPDRIRQEHRRWTSASPSTASPSTRP